MGCHFFFICIFNFNTFEFGQHSFNWMSFQSSILFVPSSMWFFFLVICTQFFSVWLWCTLNYEASFGYRCFHLHVSFDENIHLHTHPYNLALWIFIVESKFYGSFISDIRLERNFLCSFCSVCKALKGYVNFFVFCFRLKAWNGTVVLQKQPAEMNILQKLLFPTSN